MSVLSVLGKAAGVAGKGFEGYGVDRKNRVNEVLAQQQAEREAEDSRVRRLVSLAAIDPEKQRALNAAQAAGSTEGATPGLVAREERMGPVRAQNAALEVDAETPGLVSRAAQMPSVSVQPSLDPKQPAKAVTVRPGAVGEAPQVGVTEVPGVSKNTGAGGIGGGFGAGGFGGAGRTLAGIAGLGTAHENMKPFEQKVKAGQAKYDGLDYWQTQMSKMYDEKGIIDEARHAAALALLGKTNPELANYLQNAELWALEESTLTNRPSDFRTKLDAFVSALKPNTSPEMIDNITHSRQVRLEGYSAAAPALRAQLARVAGAEGSSSGKRSITAAEAAALKAQGFTDAQINAKYTVTP